MATNQGTYQMTHTTPNEIKTDRLRYVPVYGGERYLCLSARTEEEVIARVENLALGIEWEYMKIHGWTIEKYWGSEYE